MIDSSGHPGQMRSGELLQRVSEGSATVAVGLGSSGSARGLAGPRSRTSSVNGNRVRLAAATSTGTAGFDGSLEGMSLFSNQRSHSFQANSQDEATNRSSLTECQVPGCGRLLRETVKRNVRICEEHRRSMVLDMRGYLGRFCQQCSRVHNLDRFDGDKRGCRDRLQRRIVRRRKKTRSEADGVHAGNEDEAGPASKILRVSCGGNEDCGDDCKKWNKAPAAGPFASPQTKQPGGPLAQLYHSMPLMHPPAFEVLEEDRWEEWRMVHSWGWGRHPGYSMPRPDEFLQDTKRFPSSHPPMGGHPFPAKRYRRPVSSKRMASFPERKLPSPRDSLPGCSAPKNSAVPCGQHPAGPRMQEPWPQSTPGDMPQYWDIQYHSRYVQFAEMLTHK
mmetsp:Transcript_2429/g.7026  ORF Transcript_2429/g.7026 Transcript_2429/m.7026 type:complete len:389 (+) Transcript_2429:122-1288(+)